MLRQGNSRAAVVRGVAAGDVGKLNANDASLFRRRYLCITYRSSRAMRSRYANGLLSMASKPEAKYRSKSPVIQLAVNAIMYGWW